MIQGREDRINMVQQRSSPTFHSNRDYVRGSTSPRQLKARLGTIPQRTAFLFLLLLVATVVAGYLFVDFDDPLLPLQPRKFENMDGLR
jgi:hypothetical protein